MSTSQGDTSRRENTGRTDNSNRRGRHSTAWHWCPSRGRERGQGDGGAATKPELVCPHCVEEEKKWTRTPVLSFGIGLGKHVRATPFRVIACKSQPAMSQISRPYTLARLNDAILGVFWSCSIVRDSGPFGAVPGDVEWQRVSLHLALHVHLCSHMRSA